MTHARRSAGATGPLARIIHERRWRDRAGGAGCSPRGAARSGTPSSRPQLAELRSGERVTEPDPWGLHPATGPARHTRVPFVNDAR